MAVEMKTFDSARRDLLRLSSMGLAASAVSVIPALAAPSHVEVEPAKPDARPCIVTDDVHRADFFAITAPSSPAAFSFNNSTDIRVLWSRAAPDTTIA